MISHAVIARADTWLDERVGVAYLDDYGYTNLAQDWARIAKIQEELGEAIAELILWTGQNPRKGKRPEAREKMLKELADTALTAILAIQHFTKDTADTETLLVDAQEKIYARANAKDGS
jgi:hypothetical protein